MYIFFSIVAIIAYIFIAAGFFSKKSPFVKILMNVILFTAVLPFWAGTALLTVNYLLPGFEPLKPANSIYCVLLIENNSEKNCKYGIFESNGNDLELLNKSAHLNYELKFIKPAEVIYPGKTDTLVYIIDTLKYKQISIADLNKSSRNSLRVITLLTKKVPYKIFDDDFDNFRDKYFSISLTKEFTLLIFYFLAFSFLIIHIFYLKMNIFLKIVFILINLILTLFAALMIYNLVSVIIDFWIKL